MASIASRSSPLSKAMSQSINVEDMVMRTEPSRPPPFSTAELCRSESL